ncbi:MAG: hypothetical protein JWQ44_1283, partial [Chthoniobacter sp.]|nr:hypothetical protein [Chthoniobacter sp.]
SNEQQMIWRGPQATTLEKRAAAGNPPVNATGG